MNETQADKELIVKRQEVVKNINETCRHGSKHKEAKGGRRTRIRHEQTGN